MSETAAALNVSTMLQNATRELHTIQRVLDSGSELDPRLLSDFRDAVNRARTAAWAVQQYVHAKEGGPAGDIASVMAGERVRAAFQLCKTLETDLTSEGLLLQPGPLIQLSEVVHRLVKLLEEKVGK